MPDHKKKNLFSALVVTFNEEKYLKRCLDSLSFCEQVLVIDLGSKDHSLEIATRCGAETHQYPHESIVEKVWTKAMPLVSNSWVIRADPDEVFSAPLAQHLLHINLSQNTGIIALPHQYYFKEKALHKTIWGGIKIIPKVFHKDRVVFNPSVHRGILALDGYEMLRIKDITPIQHFWIDSWKQLFEKHKRYILHEGESMYTAGQRFSYGAAIRHSARSLFDGLIKKGGISGGLTGISLSFFYTWYVWASFNSLRNYQKRIKEKT